MEKKGKSSKRIESAKLEASRADLSEIFRLAYVSEASALFGPDDLREIGERSMIRNEKLDITGILVMDQGKILQILEGSQKSVMDLFAKISVDPRHQSVRQVAGGVQEARHLSCWSIVCGQGSSAPEGLKEEFLKLHARLSAREKMDDIQQKELELLKVISLFRAVPVCK